MIYKPHIAKPSYMLMYSTKKTESSIDTFVEDHL